MPAGEERQDSRLNLCLPADFHAAQYELEGELCIGLSKALSLRSILGELPDRVRGFLQTGIEDCVLPQKSFNVEWRTFSGELYESKLAV